MTPGDLWRNPGPFTLAELAGACRVSTRFLQKAIAANALEACRAGRSFRVRGSEARRFALEVGVEAPGAAVLANDAHDTNPDA